MPVLNAASAMNAVFEKCMVRDVMLEVDGEQKRKRECGEKRKRAEEGGRVLY